MDAVQSSKQVKLSVGKEFLLFLCIPASIVLIVAAIVFVPSVLAKPKYGFIYQYCSDYYCLQDYTTNSSGKITPKTNNSSLIWDSYYGRQVELYMHDMSTNTSKKISLAEANDHILNRSITSPDGYVLKQEGSSNGGFLFYGLRQTRGSWYLVNGLKKKLVDVKQSAQGDSIKFLGWTK